MHLLWKVIHYSVVMILIADATVVAVSNLNHLENHKDNALETVDVIVPVAKQMNVN